MKIYIASSWKNEIFLKILATILRGEGFEIDCFVDKESGRFVFNYKDIKNFDNLTAPLALENKKVKRAFKEDKKWLDWCDVCLLVLPAGNSAHLEAGYAKGRGKKLIIYHIKYGKFQGFPRGEFDVMYKFANLITDNIDEIIKYIKKLKARRK